MRERAARGRDIVLFLNTWSCHLPREPSVQAISSWISDHVASLERLEGVALLADDFVERAPEMMESYEAALSLKEAIPTMGDTAASKFLHVPLPDAFVMWDNNIKPFAHDYEEFLTEMHGLAGDSSTNPGSLRRQLRSGSSTTSTMACGRRLRSTSMSTTGTSPWVSGRAGEDDVDPSSS